MADNVAITAGSGTNVAADEIASVFYQRVKLSLGADGTAVDAVAGAGAVDTGVQRVTLASDDPAVTRLDTIISPGKAASASVTPSASSHTANDVVGGAMTFALGTVSGCTFLITGATFEIDTATAQVSTWTLHLYNVTPPSATADDGAWDLPSGDRASYLGSISLGTALDLGSTQWIEVNNVNKAVKLSGTGLFGYLVNGTTLTTAAVVHKVTLIGTPL